MYFLIYETKGLTLEQIDELYDEVKVARKSTKWVPTTTYTAQRASISQKGGVLPGMGEKREEDISGDAGNVEHKI